jgi:hypothetical protein
VHPVLSRVSSVQDLLAALARAAAGRGQPLRLLDAWRPVPELAAMDPQALVQELTAHQPASATAVQALRSRAVW